MTANSIEGTRSRTVATVSRALWLAVIFDLLAFGVGFGWDREWHTTHPFEDFFSPPHIFVYTMHLLATLTLAYVAFTPSLRARFGATFRLWPLPFPVPGPIAIAGGGFVVTALAGLFDGIWHTAFGLDETGWSFPHSMLGAGIFVAFVGIAACRWAIRGERPIGLPSALVFGFLLLATSAERWTGPIGNNLAPEVTRFIARIPVLAVEPEFQHTTRIYLAYGIDRSHALFVPLAALSAGMGLALLRSFDARASVTLALTALLTWTSTFVPLLVPGIVLVLFARRRDQLAQTDDSERQARRDRRAWIVAGIAFTIVTAVIWRANGGSAILGMLLFPVGVWLGRLIWSVADRPARSRVLAFVALAGIAYPAMTGIVDLALRSRVP
ncbi:MAG TPA: hypothetical protein VM052_01980 [Candidatus Limnocylindrales bacterium]|nr:hypothetical protein [Candidatus Limnocylindrales bacterium]